jgi:hypothetical protein
MKKIFFVLLVPLLMGAACSSPSDQESKPLDVDQSENTVKEDNVTEGISEDYVLYENKAVGYNILRPKDWYWQHFIKADLAAAGNNELIDDYLVLDQTPIIGLRSEYLGRIVIEQSRMDLETLKNNMSEYTAQEVNINGQAAMRFELQTDENHYFPNTKRIEYHLAKDGETLRLIYHMADSDQLNEDMFATLVNSFTWQ